MFVFNIFIIHVTLLSCPIISVSLPFSFLLLPLSFSGDHFAVGSTLVLLPLLDVSSSCSSVLVYVLFTDPTFKSLRTALLLPDLRNVPSDG